MLRYTQHPPLSALFSRRVWLYREDIYFKIVFLFGNVEELKKPPFTPTSISSIK